MARPTGTKMTALCKSRLGWAAKINPGTIIIQGAWYPEPERLARNGSKVLTSIVCPGVALPVGTIGCVVGEAWVSLQQQGSQ